MDQVKYLYDTMGLPPGKTFQIRRNAEPPGRRTELHYHDHYELMFCLTGQLPYRVEGRAYLLRPGTALLIRPYQLHQAVTSKVSVERIALRFQAGLPERLGEGGLDSMGEQASRHDDLFLLDEETQKRIYGVLRDLLREEAEEEPGRARMEEALLTQLFFYLYRASRQERGKTRLPEERQLQQVIEYMEGHLEEPLSLEELAGRFYMDRYRLSRCFTRQVGCPPHRYLMYKRLQRAALLMEEGRPVSQVPALCGFADYSNFYRRFREYFGVSPREWKKRKQGTDIG